MPYRPNGEHARLAIGGFGLAGLPVHGVGLDRKRLQSTQCVEAALRGDRLIDEFARRLSLSRRGLTYGQQQQRSRNRERVFHYRSSNTFPVAASAIVVVGISNSGATRGIISQPRPWRKGGSRLDRTPPSA